MRPTATSASRKSQHCHDGTLKQLPPYRTKDAGRAQNSRAEENKAAGLSRLVAAGTTLAASACGRGSQHGEGFGRNRSDRVFRGGRRSGILVPVNRVAAVHDRVLEI